MIVMLGRGGFTYGCGRSFDCSMVAAGQNRLIGQKTCYKTAIAIEISMAIAVLSFLKEDKGWTKNVFRMHGND